MKQCFVIFVLLCLVTSCVKRPLNYIPEEKNIMVVDFTEYSKMGFLITPRSYSRAYESVALFSYEIYPKAEKKTIVNKSARDVDFDELYNTKAITTSEQVIWDVDKINIQDAIEFAYQKAVGLGGDAIINLKIDHVNKIFLDINEQVNIDGIKISGYIIKRIKKVRTKKKTKKFDE